MPIVRIHCLPVKALDIGLAIRGVTAALATATEIAPSNISVIWHQLPADSYAHGGDLADTQPSDSHPVLVDLLAPDFHRPHVITTMMKTLAHELSGLTGAESRNVLVIHHPIGSGHVYDQGRLINW